MSVMCEPAAPAAAVIGGTSLAGGQGRIIGTVIGTIILGTMTSGLTFRRIDAYYQQIIRGMIVVAAVVVGLPLPSTTMSSRRRRIHAEGIQLCW